MKLFTAPFNVESYIVENPGLLCEAVTNMHGTPPPQFWNHRRVHQVRSWSGGLLANSSLFST